ncbi:extracellular solute-binding protein [Streptomyces shenzhenensis]|uniref:ABC transporter substrate-binding protein n=1 Tax=Streptomyces shenzhenensis TaxID=943815 RepID=UPI0033CEE646
MTTGMKHKPKLAAVVATAAAMTLGLSGCSSDSDTSGSGKQKITMFMWTSSQAEVASWKSIASLVTDKYPDIEVSFETADWSNYWTKLVADAGSSSAPCVVGIQSLRLPGVNELLAPLDDAMGDNAIEASDFNESILKAMQVDGVQKVIPYDFGPLVMYYNADAFKKAGMDAPENGWTAKEYEEIIAKLSTGGKYGTVFDANADYTLPWTLNLGGVQATDESGDLDLTNASYRGALKTLASWVKAGYAPKLSAASSSSALDQFLAGNAMTTIDGPWNLINANETAKFTVGIAPVPAGDSIQSSVTEGSGFGITRSCKNQDAAAKALSVITGAGAAEQLAKAGRAFPARTAEQTYWFTNVDAASKTALEYAAEHTQAQRTTSNWTTVVNGFSKYGVEAFNGTSSVEDFTGTVQKDAAQ